MATRDKTLYLLTLAILAASVLADDITELVSNEASNSKVDQGVMEAADLNERSKTIIKELEEAYLQHYRNQQDGGRSGQSKAFDRLDDNYEAESQWLWLLQNKRQIVNTLLAMTGLALVALVAFKYYSLSQSIKEQNQEIDGYVKQLEQIIDGTDKLVFMTWKDQKEGLKFVDNPAYKKKSADKLTKTEQIQAEIEKVEGEIGQKSQEIDSLREKELYYTTEIESLERELGEGKALVLDEGAALGFADTVLKEFK